MSYNVIKRRKKGTLLILAHLNILKPSHLHLDPCESSPDTQVFEERLFKLRLTDYE